MNSPVSSDLMPGSTTERFLTVRMYDAGFGDCFLLTIPQPNSRPLKVLFDCGSIKNGVSDTSIRKIAQQVIADLRDDTDNVPRVDVVVATHRHRDHISGFDALTWGDVEAGEVWMPWTEKPDDSTALEIRDMQYRLAGMLDRQLNYLIENQAAQPLDAKMLAQCESGLEMAMNALSNDDAMHTLHHGFAGNPERHYYPEEQATTTWFTTSRLPGVVIHVLGPSRDPSAISELDPPAGQSYLRMMEAAFGKAGKQTKNPKPFDDGWIVQPGDYKKDKELYGELDEMLNKNDRKRIQDASRGPNIGAATALDRAINGTSLALIFEIGKARLLFPGDAQWGTWRLALENPDFRKLLSKVNFVKVGHHGSHNATPVEFVENVMGKDVCAMISVNPTKSWPLVPKEELLEKLRGKEGCKLVRSDKPDDMDKAVFNKTASGIAIEAKIPF